MADYGWVDRSHVQDDAQERIDVLLENSDGQNTRRSRVALHDGTVVGGLLAGTFGPAPQIDVLFVAPEIQRRGFGTALLHEFAQAARADDEPRIASTSHPADRASRGWHRATGFSPLPDRTLIRHLHRYLRTNLGHGHVAEQEGRPAHAPFGQIDARLQDAERKRFAAAHPARWRREEDLLEQHTVS